MNRGPAVRYDEDYERGTVAGRPGTYLQDNARRDSRRTGGRGSGRGGAYYDDRRLEGEEYDRDLDEPY